MHRPQAPRTWVALALGLVFLLLAIAITLSRSPPVVSSSNSVEAAVEFESVTGHFLACQANELLPRDTTAIRLSLDASLGPRVKLTVLSDKRLVTSGERSAGWTAADVTIPVRPVAQTIPGVKICFQFYAQNESVGLTGQQTSGGHSPQANRGSIKIEYLKPGVRSWWSLAPSVALYMAFGHAWSGIWLIPFLGAIMVAMLAIVSWLALRLGRSA